MSNSNEALSLKELFILIMDHFSLWWAKKYWILTIALPFIGYFVVKAISKDIDYVAKTSFLIENQNGENTFGGLSGLLGSIGVKNVGKLSPFQIIEVSKSHKLMGGLLFDTPECDSMFIANRLIEDYELEKNWIKNQGEVMRGFRFKNNKIDEFDRFENVAYKTVCDLVFGNQQSTSENSLCRLEIDEFTGIFKLNTKIKSTCISYNLNRSVFKAIRNIFEEKTKEKRKKTADILSFKRDSLKLLAFQKAESIGRAKDRNSNLISELEKSKIEKMNIELQGLTIAYAEVSKNFEISDLTFRDLNNMFYEIDKPYLPLQSERISTLKNGVIGTIIGGFVGILFFSLRHIYHSIMKS